MTTNACFSDVSTGRCEGLLSINLTFSMCCCSIGAAWGDSERKTCNPCPTKSSALYNKLCTSGGGVLPGGSDIDECKLFSNICENGI